MNILYILKALADETRLRIFALLDGQELNVNELVAILEMGQSRISRHLKIMTDCGLLRCRRDGLWSFYSTGGEKKLTTLLQELRGCLEEIPENQEDRRRSEQVLLQRSRRNTQLFNTLAENWQEIKAEIFGEVELNREIRQVIPEGRALADIGCGNGDLLHELQDKAHMIIGVDNSPRMLEQAWELLQPAGERIDLRLGNIEHLPLKDREVENAVINMVLHHSDSPTAILQETNRILQPGGHLILAEFTKHTREIMRSRYGDRHLGFDPGYLRQELKTCGFLIESELNFPLSGGMEIIVFVTRKED